MTQEFPVTPSVIYDTLTSDTTFMSYIGTYTFVSGGTQIDSVSILTPGQTMPQVQSQSGLECIIHDSGDMRRMDYLTDTSTIVPFWNVFLIVWPPATGETMSNATIRVLELFSGASSFETVPVTSGIGALVQTKIVIPANKPVLA